MLNRGPRWGTPRWWLYCERHMFGRWIEDGQVMEWSLRIRPDSSAGTDPA